MASIVTNSTIVTTLTPVLQNVTIKATLDAYGPIGTYTYGSYAGTFNAAVFGSSSTEFTIDNKGLIESIGTGDLDAGIFLGAFGTITNTGSIIGSSAILMYGTTGFGVVTNSGLIDGSLVAAIGIGSYGKVTNSGTIEGGVVGVAIARGGSVINSKIIEAGEDGIALGASTSSYVDNTGSITAGGTGVYLAGAGTVINSGAVYGDDTGIDGGGVDLVKNTGTIFGNEYGVDLYPSGGTVINSGLIESYRTGVYTGGEYTNAPSVITNAKGGTIFSGDAIQMESGGSVNNAGLVYGIDDGIDAYGNATVTNTGTVIGYFDTGIFLAGPTLAITNSGLISAEYDAIGADGDTFALTNTGTIIGGQSYYDYGEDEDYDEFSAAVTIDASATVNNSGLISGGYAGLSAEGAYENITNSGSILGFVGDGINVDSATLSLVNTKLIVGGDAGIYGDEDYATVNNSGTIVGSLFAGIELYAATIALTNSKLIIGGEVGLETGYFDEDEALSVSIGNTGTIIGTRDLGVGIGAEYVTVTNSKLIMGGFAGLDIYNSYEATVTNTGSIIGTLEFGIGLYSESATITNSGLIYSNGEGIGESYYYDDEDEVQELAVTNSGTIDGKYGAGIDGDFYATIYNTGLITSGDEAIDVEAADITNSAAGVISATYGDAIDTDELTLVNAGKITSKYEAAVVGYDGVYVTNASTGVIKGEDGVIGYDEVGTVTNLGTIMGTKYDGIYLDEGGTIVDSGVISGKEYGVYLATNDTNLLELTTSAKLTGNVYLGGGELELTTGSSIGTLAIGTVSGFDSIVVSAKAEWELSGVNTIGAGVALTNSGTLIEKGSDHLVINGNVYGTGTIVLGTAGLALNSYVSSQTIDFTGKGDLLTIGSIDSFDGVINDFAKSETIDLSGISLSSVTGTSFADGVLTISAASTYFLTFANPASFSGEVLAYFADGSGLGITLTPANTEGKVKMAFVAGTPTADSSVVLPAVSSVATSYTAAAPAITASSSMLGFSGTDLLKSHPLTAVPAVTLHA
jgi:hypothetical protein